MKVKNALWTYKRARVNTYNKKKPSYPFTPSQRVVVGRSDRTRRLRALATDCRGDCAIFMRAGGRAR